MKKRYFVVPVALILSLAILAVANATPKKRLDEKTQTCRTLTFHNSGWVSVGHELFENNCKTCHFRGNTEGAPFLFSESKTMKGWNRVFFSQYPACARDGKWQGLSEEELRQLNDYLFRNAANTYNANDAEDCG